ncbi:MAG: methyltransferase domain-containing protein [Deltaproteobacteria bacterium]|nr:methyltransferase domain-containing protein [Nannocystaceae bacterium]
MSGSTKPAGDVPHASVAATSGTGVGAAGARPLDSSVKVGPVKGLEGAASLPSEFSSHVHGTRVADLVDRLAGEVVLRHAPGRIVLDLGHGAPQVTEWVRPRAAALTVIDAVDLGRGATIRLPWPDGRFELVYSLRTLPHLGHDEQSSDAALRSLLGELARVLAPGGTALCLIDNPRSLWGVYYGIRHPAHAIERGALVVESERGLTRFDTLPRFVGMLPDDLVMTDVHGLRVLTTLPQLLALPLLGRLLNRMEWVVRDRVLLRSFGAHLLVVLHRPARLTAAGNDVPPGSTS